jgi:hypothetical protein
VQGCQIVHIFSNQKSHYCWRLECLAMNDVVKFSGHSVYFTAISYNLWPFFIFCGHFGIFFPVLVCCTKKNLATLISCRKRGNAVVQDNLILRGQNKKREKRHLSKRSFFHRM